MRRGLYDGCCDENPRNNYCRGCPDQMTVRRTGLVLRGFGDDIEMPPDFVGKGADPNITGQAPPPPPVFEGAFKDMIGSIASVFGTPTTPTKTTVVRPGLPRPSIMPKVMLAGLAIGAFFLIKRANQ